ncbi:long-chain-fatty-acid--CoA ligase [Sporosarcina sp. ACRSM]|uniref:class I adenylate-forming enzyme family protein n=1 Tax=Sporosarcina sp. ACRSM TaxID=2918216 RepID=UPI001EF651A8|nr:long-chain-fatty-acid--CoA ligase [Sporosarcina sp. ACRSM]
MANLKTNLNVSDTLRATATRLPNREAIYDESRRMTYGQLDQEVTNLAKGLIRIGVTSGDRVAVALTNSCEYVTAFFAIARVGAVLIPLNPFFSKEESVYILQQAEAKALFCDTESYYSELSQETETLSTLISVRFQAADYMNYTELLVGHNSEEVRVAPTEDLFAIMFTSGTTGRPKGAMLTHENVLFSAMAGSERMKCTEEDVFLIPNPLFHVMGVTFILRATYCGGKLVIMQKYSVKTALSLIETEKVTVHPGVPTMFILELNSPDFNNYDLSSLRTGEMAAAPCPVEIVKQIRSKMNCNVLVAYGSTETAATLTMTGFDDDDTLRSETVGRPVHGVEVKVVDDHRKECAVGAVGELVCKGPGVTKGYYKMPEETVKVIDHEGWFYTGDMATIDENGYVRIVGRKKELIIRGGYNIYPRELEEALHQHPAIADAAVIGLPDELFGELTCACIVLKENITTTEEQLLAYMKERLVKYKVPDKFIILDKLPITASGKISKLKLKEQLDNHISITS